MYNFCYKILFVIFDFFFSPLNHFLAAQSRGDCSDQKGFSGGVFLLVATIVFNLWIFTEETRGTIAQEVQINSTGSTSL